METIDTFWLNFALALLTAIVTARIITSWFTPRRQFGAMSQTHSATPSPCHIADAEMPTVENVSEVKRILHLKRLPLELIDNIIDFAEYWPYTTTSTSHTFSANHINENVFVVGCPAPKILITFDFID